MTDKQHDNQTVSRPTPTILPFFNVPLSAVSAATQGFILGSSKWLALASFLAIAGHYLSPIYRGVTVQFKVYLFLSAGTVGGWVEADRRFRAFEKQRRIELVRARQRLEFGEGAWQAWEDGEQQRLERRAKRRAEIEAKRDPVDS